MTITGGEGGNSIKFYRGGSSPRSKRSNPMLPLSYTSFRTLALLLDLFTDGKTDFPTAWYTSTSEVPTLSYTRDLKNGTPFGQSLPA